MNQPSPLNQLSPPRHYLCYRATEPLILDGRLDKTFWHAAPWTDTFVDIEGDFRPPPRFRTRVKMLWDDDFFYIGADMEEPHVWATITEHDAVIFQDNDFEVFIDPDGDNHDYYEIEINALNTTWDLRLVKPYRDGGPALNEWEIPGFRSAVHIDGTLNTPSNNPSPGNKGTKTKEEGAKVDGQNRDGQTRGGDQGWSVEMALPWRALAEHARCAAPPHIGNQWRINFSRVEWDVEIADGQYRKIPDRPEHNWVWSPQGVIDMHRPEKWGYVQFAGLPAEEARFCPDPAAPIRDRLMALYYAQQAFHDRTGHWAALWEDLGLPWPHQDGLTTPPRIHLTAQGYTATCERHPDTGPSQQWHIREDSRLWTE